jgi:hypothetical protein
MQTHTNEEAVRGRQPEREPSRQPCCEGRRRLREWRFPLAALHRCVRLGGRRSDSPTVEMASVQSASAAAAPLFSGKSGGG